MSNFHEMSRKIDHLSETVLQNSNQDAESNGGEEDEQQEGNAVNTDKKTNTHVHHAIQSNSELQREVTMLRHTVEVFCASYILFFSFSLSSTYVDDFALIPSSWYSVCTTRTQALILCDDFGYDSFGWCNSTYTHRGLLSFWRQASKKEDAPWWLQKIRSLPTLLLQTNQFLSLRFPGRKRYIHFDRSSFYVGVCLHILAWWLVSLGCVHSLHNDIPGARAGKTNEFASSWVSQRQHADWQKFIRRHKSNERYSSNLRYSSARCY